MLSSLDTIYRNVTDRRTDRIPISISLTRDKNPTISRTLTRCRTIRVVFNVGDLWLQHGVDRHLLAEARRDECNGRRVPRRNVGELFRQLHVFSSNPRDTNNQFTVRQEAQLSQRSRATVSIVETLKYSFGVNQDHRKWHHLKVWVRFPICVQ